MQLRPNTANLYELALKGGVLEFHKRIFKYGGQFGENIHDYSTN